MLFRQPPWRQGSYCVLRGWPPAAVNDEETAATENIAGDAELQGNVETWSGHRLAKYRKHRDHCSPDSKALFHSLLSGCQDDSDSDGSSPDSPPSPNKGATTNGSPSPALNSVLNSGSVVSSASSVTNPADLAPIYRIGGQPVVSLAGAVAGGASSSGCSPATVTVLPGSQSSLGTLMYQTPQGLLYAAPPGGSLPEALLLNLGQPVSLKTEGGTCLLVDPHFEQGTDLGEASSSYKFRA
ncbi:hypothetical protein HPB51_003614 [Rhipicephalus microplus]|uniref:Uncharacterized protein n=1 Tax=Rhipicephalus microplus TaxID=6941 RepID=A0A9J6DYW1_RHIMP|nr:hypothetical protein HPB51_003614 [Rhipicephalus microplus]